MKHIVAGLDLSLTAAAVAVLRTDGTVACATFGYSLKKKASQTELLRRLVYVTNQVVGMLKAEGVTQVGIEHYGFAAGAKSGSLAFSAELGGSVKVQLWAGLKIMPLIIPVTSVRKYLLGKSTKDKKVVRKHLEGLGFTQPKNLDESDALAVALVADDYFNRRAGLVDLHRMNTFERFDSQRS